MPNDHVEKNYQYTVNYVRVRYEAPTSAVLALLFLVSKYTYSSAIGSQIYKLLKESKDIAILTSYLGGMRMFENSRYTNPRYSCQYLQRFKP